MTNNFLIVNLSDFFFFNLQIPTLEKLPLIILCKLFQVKRPIYDHDFTPK